MYRASASITLRHSRAVGRAEMLRHTHRRSMARVGWERLDRGLAIAAKGSPGIMHDRIEIVKTLILGKRRRLIEIAGEPFIDVFEQYGQVRISIIAALLVPQTPGVSDFMDGVAGTAAVFEQDKLRAPHHAY